MKIIMIQKQIITIEKEYFCNMLEKLLLLFKVLGVIINTAGKLGCVTEMIH